jgi:hypothetical protein
MGTLEDTQQSETRFAKQNETRKAVHPVEVAENLERKIREQVICGNFLAARDLLPVYRRVVERVMGDRSVSMPDRATLKNRSQQMMKDLVIIVRTERAGYERELQQCQVAGAYAQPERRRRSNLEVME